MIDFFEKLDCALCNEDRRVKFPEAFMKVLSRIQSDHYPILINLWGKPIDKID